MESRTMPPEPGNKRPRSPSGDYTHSTPSTKVPKTHSNHLQINYLARQYAHNIPLVSAEDTLPSILRIINDYDGVLQRHESIAGNLGACPLGPILVSRFERLFDGPPKVLKSHGKEGTTVSWLDVVEFAKNKPEQFTLEKTRNGVPVCQIYTKQSRIEISEEDYILIKSGIPQKIIPPQPIVEDEEKELGALEILEKNLGQIINLADQVSARARQLNHRFKNRKSAIVSRRENDLSLTARQPRSISPLREANGNGMGTAHTSNGHSSPHSPQGFIAVNSSSRHEHSPDDASILSAAQFMFPHSSTDNVTIINGTSIKGASPATRAELMKKFFTTADRHARGYQNDEVIEGPAPPARHASRSRPRASDPGEYGGGFAGSGPVAIPNTPSSLLPQPKSSNHYERDDGGPYKIEMVSRMEGLQRGERILPPCDRCRRLQMDCHKNLTACMGCTKKHAKCSWKEVKIEELHETYLARPQSSIDGGNGNMHDGTMPTIETEAETSASASTTELGKSQRGNRTPNVGGINADAGSTAGTDQGPIICNPNNNTNNNNNTNTRRASEPQTRIRHTSKPRSQSENSMLAGLAEAAHEPDRWTNNNNNDNTHGDMHSAAHRSHPHPHSYQHQHTHPHAHTQALLDTDADDNDSTDPLAQAIRDTMGKHNLAAAAAAARSSGHREREMERQREREIDRDDE
ncbi:C6 finger domain-containing protein [Blastomyces gilchristii SLH14081]|uniref:C6 finger domain-containing protein n=1 Tax=Blastomyces gilchristii (strain SLH14081) TaxID=559298 RepID=A0A179URZ3_BLAGS|nr:C6 finger domain-containing protein [Blastomyces gilchristii SLH14081]OAT10620.1 C6 finger domain-containing protein [Blastomyces gilchristii SLH14081]